MRERKHGPKYHIALFAVTLVGAAGIGRELVAKLVADKRAGIAEISWR
jgi:hypothetical protein